MVHRWLYALILAMDANFKLKCKDRGINDVELAPGWAYFVEQNRYMAHLKDHVDEPEVSCSCFVM
jgi:hypothetical protein